jgi:hypothetical protein
MNKNTKKKTAGPKKSSAKVKDLKPRKNPKGGLPAIQKVRGTGGLDRI